MDPESLQQLDDCIAEAEEQVGKIRALTLRSANQRYFCVGANIKVLATIRPDNIEDWIRRGHEVFNRLEDLPIPTIARVQGYALGGGLELALACDLIYADQTAVFGQPEGRLGFVTGWGASRRLPMRVGSARAKALCFSGEPINAHRAQEIGLAEVFENAEQLDTAIGDFAQSVGECASTSVSEFNQLLGPKWSSDREACAELEAKASVRCLESDETQGRLRTFLEKRSKRRW